MVSIELELAIRKVLSKIGDDPVEVWKPWIDVSYESGFDLPGLLTVFLWQDSKDKSIQRGRNPPVFQEFSKLPSISPWSELFSFGKDCSTIMLNQCISDDDWQKVFLRRFETSCLSCHGLNTPMQFITLSLEAMGDANFSMTIVITSDSLKD